MVEKISIQEVIQRKEEQQFINASKKFICQDKDVEKFLKEKALDFDKRNRSRTYLLIDSDNDDEILILGYYTITMKNLPFNETVSKSMIKRIDGYSNNINSAESVLIGQLGKDYNHRNELSGVALLNHAMNTVYSIQKLAAGRIVFLECDDNEKIISFYKDNGFILLQMSGKYMQMIRHL